MTSENNLRQLRPAEGHEYENWLTAQVPRPFDVQVLPPDPAGRYSAPPCRVRVCVRVSTTPQRLCRLHATDWEGQSARHPSLDAWSEQATASSVRQRKQGGDASLGLFRLSHAANKVVRLELALGLSRRAEGDGAPIRAATFNKLAASLEALGATTVLPYADGDPRAALAAMCGSHWDSARAFLDSTIAIIHEGRATGEGRIVIGRRRGGSNRYSQHHNIEQPWLRELVRKWTDYRRNIESGSPQHIGQMEAMVVQFAAFCGDRGVTSPKDFDRELLIAWGGRVNAMKNPKTGRQFSGTYRAKHFSAVANFVDIVRDEFDGRVPANAKYRRGEMPKSDPSNPRFLEPHAIETLRAETNLVLIENESVRLIIRIMISAGLRVGHTCALPFDCLRDLNRNGSDDRWGLELIDTKSNRALLLPVTPDVAREIRKQQRAVREANGGTSPDLLFPNPKATKTGQFAPERINTLLQAWVEHLNLKEADGTIMKVTPHRFRHTFAVEMLEKGVPIDVVKELLGHRSLESTQVYATVTDTRLRREWEKSQAVNIRGEIIEMGEGDEGDVDWLLHRLGNAVQPLSNGWCGLPIQQECPHANACLDCDNFITGPEFLPVLKQQHGEHARFVSDAERNGAFRLVEINKRPMKNLERIIATIEGDIGE